MSVGTWPCSRPKRNNVAAQKACLHMRLLMRFLVRFRVQNVPYPTLSEGFVAITVSSPWSIPLQVLDLSRNSRPSWSFSSMGMAPLSASRSWIREKVFLTLNNLRSMGLQNKLPNADMRVRASSKIILLPENSQFSTRRRSFLQTSRNHVIVPVQITWCDCKFLSRIQVSDLSFFHPSPEAILRQPTVWTVKTTTLSSGMFSFSDDWHWGMTSWRMTHAAFFKQFIRMGLFVTNSFAPIAGVRERTRAVLQSPRSCFFVVAHLVARGQEVWRPQKRLRGD